VRQQDKETLAAWVMAVVAAVFIGFAMFGLIKFMEGDPPPSAKIAVTNPASTPGTVYVLQSFYEDQSFVDGVFSSVTEAEQWMEDAHGSFERSEPDTMNVYEAGDFTYLITTYEVDDHG
jgi:hypothetical protein